MRLHRSQWQTCQYCGVHAGLLHRDYCPKPWMGWAEDRIGKLNERLKKLEEEAKSRRDRESEQREEEG
jgi:hypothetical protein